MFFIVLLKSEKWEKWVVPISCWKLRLQRYKKNFFSLAGQQHTFKKSNNERWTTVWSIGKVLVQYHDGLWTIHLEKVLPYNLCATETSSTMFDYRVTI